MKVTTSKNHTVVTFNIFGFGNKLVNEEYFIHQLSKKHNAQEMLFQNAAPWIFDKLGNATPANGNAGGSITFHAHSCNHCEAAKELIDLLISFGYNNPEYYIEVVKTHRLNGIKYKMPQTFLEKV